MTAIVDYASLKTEIANWIHRDDLTSMIPSFISAAEGKMSAEISARSMETRTTLTCTAGNAYVTLPTDMLEMNRLYVAGDPVTVLRYEAPDQLLSDYPTSMTGQPTIFTVIGSQAQLAPIPDSAYTLELSYVQKIPSLSDAAPTNWLILAFPNVYLFAALYFACKYIKDDEQVGIYEKLYKEAIGAINSIDWYSGTTLRVRVK